MEHDFDAWYQREHPRVVSTVVAVTGRPSIAADVADEAFTRACERWVRVRAMESPGGWVTATALNEARRRLRRAGHERRLMIEVASTVPVEAPPPSWSDEVWEALAALPRREREAVALRYVADLPVEDTGIPPGTEVVMAQCAAEVADAPRDSSSVLNWCSGISYGRIGDPLTFTVRRVLQLADGPVDCAAPDRCVVALRIGGAGGTDDRAAVLRFREDLPPPPARRAPWW